MSHTNLTLGSNWDKSEWPDYVFVTHGAYDGARYVPERTCHAVVKGKGTSITCSVCKEDLYWPFNYCPNCGARVIE